jgi:hypothetical protein
MSESLQRKAVIRALYALHAVPIENPLRAGIPDVAYINGWIELKYLKAWPKRPETPVRIHHFTKQQRIWLRRHCQLGGNSFLLIQCKREWLLFDGLYASTDVGNVCLAELKQNTKWYSDGGLKPRELQNVLESFNENRY